MIAFIEGKVAEKNHGELVINAGGVGFSLLCSNTTIAAAPDGDKTWRCYTVMNVREDAMELFGFATKEEKEMYLKLLSVSGIGPKAEIAILSDLTPNRFALLVASGDSSALTKVKGVGKKSAERIVVDLKDKLAKTNPAMQA